MANAIVTQRDTQLERQRAGYIQLSLTNFTNNNEPTIAAGSVVEISGTLYSVTSNESIAGWGAISNGPVWIKLVPDGVNPFSAEYTATAPTWIDAKQGWYDGTGTDRYVAGLTKTGASGYADKFNMTAVERGASIFNGIVTVNSQASNIARTDYMGNRQVISRPAVDATAQIIPKGLYYMELTRQGTADGTNIAIEMRLGESFWTAVAVIRDSETSSFFSMIISDGTSLRVRRTAGSRLWSFRLFRLDINEL